jgi:hypothetical protein
MIFFNLPPARRVEMYRKKRGHRRSRSADNLFIWPGNEVDVHFATR